MWVPVDGIPYDRMWADDAHWLPLMLAGKRFSGRFLFDAARMVDHRLDVEG
jgi:8-oxo-dGTP diphosphatase